ncbi:phosphoenolpyruvate synthase [Desulfurobacterium pacificum]|uniref:Phosphoenolpyruvate synthase n=1 Tax=Desulfurobacterium pacificum TaxID=240166 RepID=A0ABY1NVJ0_9BACT|nr:phosphoenolpyruvate synthase [Desulfurobacterium pacificum]SMP19088.1 phosphoenolpyruvate synthase [Desulfurobacterium pacificum]
MEKLVLWLDEVGIEDIPIVGGKNASLGEMIRKLSPKGIKIPYGFVVTAEAYRYFISYNRLDKKIRDILERIDVSNVKELEEGSREIRNLIRSGRFPEDLKAQVIEAYQELSQRYGVENVDVAVRSSATAEDLPNASFAGQQETYLNVRGTCKVLDSIRKCFASLFTERALSYREKFGFDHFRIALAVGVQKMVRSDLASSGVAFSLDTETGFRNVVLITGSYGLGEYVVKGVVVPDEWFVFKPTLEKGFRAIIDKKLGIKDKKLIYDESGVGVVEAKVDERDRNRFSLSDDEVLTLARWVMEIERYYSKPMDVEWAKDGETGELYVVQARPETVHGSKKSYRLEIYKLTLPESEKEKRVLLKGIAVGKKVAYGKVKVLKSLEEAEKFEEGDVLVADITDPDWEPLMRKASAIVTNRGGRTCHAAIVARELGVPAVVGTGNATEILNDGDEVTVSCCEGSTGYIYEGKVDYSVEEVDVSELPSTKTPIMLNVASPDRAFELSFLPSAGVGLAREEFIINNYIGIHPLALINFDDLSVELKEQIEEITVGYEDKKSFYVDKLAYGIARIAAAFYPKPVILRFSDFKSNEYAHLLGGSIFEPAEENPMLGWRGASRYYSDKFKEAFGLECLAVKKVREEMGLDNLIVMVPFCRTPEEGKKVLEVMKEFGLERGKEGLEVYVMCEIPSNVILGKEFAEVFDGFSIGSNDLTQLTLGVDRDSSLVAHIYDERNEAVKWMVEKAIENGKNYGRKVGICGQAPSDYPEFLRFLIEKRIDSISVNPDALVDVLRIVSQIERELESES